MGPPQFKLDEVLLYLISGEEETLLKDSFPRQPDARQILDRAWEAIELLAGDEVGAGVRDRLNQLLRDVHSYSSERNRRIRPIAFTRGTEFLRPPVGARVDRFKKTLRDSARDSDCKAAVRLGALQVDRLPSLVIEATSIRPLVPVEADPVEEPPAAASRVNEAEPYRAPIPGGGSLDLWVKGGETGRTLMLRLADGVLAVTPLQALWLPRDGEPIRASNDGAGMAFLTLPAEGIGLIRIDALRTLEMEFHIRM